MIRATLRPSIPATVSATPGRSASPGTSTMSPVCGTRPSWAIRYPATVS